MMVVTSFVQPLKSVMVHIFEPTGRLMAVAEVWGGVVFHEKE
jgi:hypothetical protein